MSYDYKNSGNVTFRNESTGEKFTLPAYVLRGAFGGTNFSGSDQAKELTGGKEPVTQRSQTVIENAIKTAVDTISGGAQIFNAIVNNWKLVLIAIVGLLIILKD